MLRWFFLLLLLPCDDAWAAPSSHQIPGASLEYLFASRLTALFGGPWLKGVVSPPGRLVSGYHVGRGR